MATESVRPTDDTYRGFQAAYDHFNTVLFGGRLPACMITLRTFGKARGYFSADRFAHLSEVTTTHETALDPRQFVDRTDVEVLSTLAHEMCHLEQREFGSPSRNRYHNRQWVALMERIGLIASATGRPGGKQTGQAMTHYTADGGPFQAAALELVDSGRFRLAWADIDGFTTNSTRRAGKGRGPKSTTGGRRVGVGRVSATSTCARPAGRPSGAGRA